MFNEKVNAYIAGISKEVDQSVLGQVLQYADNQVTNARIRVHGNTIRKNKQQAVAESSLAINNFGQEAARLAREGNAVGSAEAIQNAFTTIDALVESEDLAVDKAAQMKRGIEREASEQVLRLQFDGLIESEGVEAAFNKIEEIENNPAKGWTPDEWDMFTSSIKTSINRELARESARNREVLSLATQKLKEYQNAVSLGFEVSHQEQTEVERLVDGTGLEPKYKLINEVSSFSVLPLDQRINELNRLQTGELVDVEKYSALLKANQEINKIAMKDGYSLGAKQGIIEPIEFDLSNPESIKARTEQAKMLSDHYGVPVPPITDTEANQLSIDIENMTIPEKVSAAVSLNQAPEIWGKISSKNQMVFSMAGASGDTNLMSNVFKGQELIQKKLVTMPPANDFLLAFNDYVSDVYGIEDKKAVLETAKAHYAATAENDGIFSEDALIDSINAVTGGISEVNGYKVELPRGVTDETFSDYIDNITPEFIGKLGGVASFTDEQAAELIQTSRIKNIGNNKYVVMVNDSQALFKKDGSPLVISYTDENFADALAEKQAAQKKREFEIREKNLALETFPKTL